MSQKQARLRTLQKQIKRLQTRSAALRAVSNRYSWLRLAIFVIGIAASLLALSAVGSGLFWLGIIITLIVFNIAAGWHTQVNTTISRFNDWIKLKTIQIARMTLDWQAIPPIKGVTPQAMHPFESDLDLTGERSIHQLLNTAVSREGTLRLRDWLLNTTPDVQVIRRRQALLAELTPLTLFRDKLILKAIGASKGIKEQWEGQKLLKWLSQHSPSASLRPRLIILSALAALDIGLFILVNLGLVLPTALFVSFTLYAGLYLVTAIRFGDFFDEAAALQEGLLSLQAILGYLEKYGYANNENLKALCQPLLDPAERPTIHLRRLAFVVSGSSLAHNQILWLLVNGTVPWSVFVAYRLERCKVDLARLLPIWLNIWFELEALSSLANFAYLNPEYTLPEVADTISSGGEPILRATALGHPLIPDEQRVSNDFFVNKLGEVTLITGSNMSGKSSFLRTLGVNLCLAYAGGPVVARSLHTPLFRLFTCLKVSDSVTDGVSYFYAEVKRLKALLLALEQPVPLPLFFLIDEIFRGTNNRERLIGSRAYIRALVGHNGLGVISTHDLELIKLADELSQITNAHFEETISDGRMIFDYKLRPGPSPTTNALKIMRIEGLPVENMAQI